MERWRRAPWTGVALPERGQVSGVVSDVSIEPGVLYVVATPIGNLEDISARALRVLGSVDLVAAEDTRRTRALLTHYGIVRPLISVHEHNEEGRLADLLARLEAGRDVALVSDAGTPLVSDPGYPLVRAARAAGLRVVPVPGASSLLAALSVAGLPTDRFTFEGFLPPRAGARRGRLEALAAEPRTVVFFESSHRIQDSLADMAAALGEERPAVVARELTKRYEQVQDGTLGELARWLAGDDQRRRGEFVVVVAGAPGGPAASDEVAARRVLLALLEELPAGRAAAVAARITGLGRKVLYEMALELAGR